MGCLPGGVDLLIDQARKRQRGDERERERERERAVDLHSFDHCVVDKREQGFFFFFFYKCKKVLKNY